MRHSKHTMHTVELSRPRKTVADNASQVPKVETTRPKSERLENPVAVQTPTGPTLNPALRHCAFLSLLALFVLCIAWELWIDPVVVGGSIYFLKALPLMFALYGVFKGNLYTMQWSSMLVLLYLLEGAVRGYSDISPLSKCLARIEFSLALVAFLSAIFYVRPAKKWAKAQGHK